MKKFIDKGLTKVVDLIDVISKKWISSEEICGQLGLRSVRKVEQFIDEIKVAFPSQLLQSADCFLSGEPIQCFFS